MFAWPVKPFCAPVSRISERNSAMTSSGPTEACGLNEALGGKPSHTLGLRKSVKRREGSDTIDAI